ncbi:MAG: winged helix-turn-helix transcriptional regulator [Candidatus Thorarchaeota archaeon]|nr:winged helix-turn-helix transcriptional regulator [Candidatus Thorarchaeota archaeon]
MDSIDKSILLELDADCRLSYQALADKIGITANAIRKRLDRLIETGVIEEFVVLLKPAMVGSEYLIVLVNTDGTENEEEFIQHLGANINVIQVGQLATGSGRMYFVHCEYIGTEGLKNLGSFFRQLDPVTTIELHTTIASRGQEFKIKRFHLQVLKILLEDARASVSQIAESLGHTSRRVGRAIQEMLDSNAFWFSTRWNLSQGDNTEFYLKITYDEKTSTNETVDAWLQETYPNEYWYAFYSATEPVVFAKFVTNHFRVAREIARVVRTASYSCSVDVLLSYPVTKFPRVGLIKLQQMIADAGL